MKNHNAHGSRSPYHLKGRVPPVLTAAIAALGVGLATQAPTADAKPGVAISAEPYHKPESHKKAVEHLDHAYRKLAESAETIAKSKDDQDQNVLITTTSTVFTDGSKGSVLQIQGDTYNPATEEVQVCVASLYVPDKDDHSREVKPYSIFNISVFTGSSLTQPTSAAEFNTAVKDTYYNFSLTKGENGDWDVSAYRPAEANNYNTGTPSGLGSVAGNQSLIGGDISEAAYMLSHIAEAGGQLN
jgi:hypothetical protein